MTGLQAIPCPRPKPPTATLEVCYGCNELRPAVQGCRSAGGGPWWCGVCRDAAEHVQTRIGG